MAGGDFGACPQDFSGSTMTGRAGAMDLVPRSSAVSAVRLGLRLGMAAGPVAASACPLVTAAGQACLHLLGRRSWLEPLPLPCPSS